MKIKILGIHEEGNEVDQVMKLLAQRSDISVKHTPVDDVSRFICFPENDKPVSFNDLESLLEFLEMETYERSLWSVV